MAQLIDLLATYSRRKTNSQYFAWSWIVKNLGKLKLLCAEMKNSRLFCGSFCHSCKSALRNELFFWRNFCKNWPNNPQKNLFFTSALGSFIVNLGLFFREKIWWPAHLCACYVYILLRLSTFRRYERELKFPLKDFHEFLMNFLDKMVFLSCQSSWKDMD